jgi:iron complex outermembrane receptor protein
VGNVVTNPNPLLDPETLTSVEGGALVRWTRLSLRATAFFNDLEEAIANATISSTPTLIIRQRRNSDTIRAVGVELEADARVSPALSLSGQIVFTSSHFRDSIANPAIEGNAVPQVPAVLGALSLTRTDPRFVTASTQVRFSSRQFDDDLNAFVLGAYGVWDAQVSRPVIAGVTAFAAVENILDTEFDTARTPQRQIGWPRTVRAGVRATWR